MKLRYELKGGSYYLYDMATPASPYTGERRCRLKTDMVAIAFDASTGRLHQHGSVTRIQTWALSARRRLRAAGAHDSADDIVVISGPLPVDELNKCLGIDGYCRRLLKRLASLPNGKSGRVPVPPPMPARGGATSMRAWAPA